MRVTMTELRSGGRWIGHDPQKTMHGELLTKKFIGGERLVKVLEFVRTGCAPGQFNLSDARVKECWSEKSTIVFSGLAMENDAWVAQEWLIDVAPHQGDEKRMGIGWINPARHREPQT